MLFGGKQIRLLNTWKKQKVLSLNKDGKEKTSFKNKYIIFNIFYVYGPS